MTYLIYLLEASLILAGFYFFYRWLIRPLTFYGYKRVLLLAIPLLAVGLPLLQIDLGWQPPVQQISWIPAESPAVEAPAAPEENQTIESNAKTIATTSEASTWHWSQWLLLAYCIGAAIAVIFFLYKLLKVFLMHRKSSFWQQNIYLSLLAKPAYSFAGRIYLHPDLPGEPEFQHILKHEQVHVQQWHTLDLILFELLKILFWFNPLSWWLANESRLNNEMLADQVSAAEGCKTDYAKLLLKYACRNPQQLSYSFARLQVRSRIEGVLKNPSANKEIYRFAIFLPVLAYSFLIFACEEPRDIKGSEYLYEGESLKKLEAVITNEYGGESSRKRIFYSYEFNTSGEVVNSFKPSKLRPKVLTSNLILFEICAHLSVQGLQNNLLTGIVANGLDFLPIYARQKENNIGIIYNDLNRPFASDLHDLSRTIETSVVWQSQMPVKIEENITHEIVELIFQKNNMGETSNRFEKTGKFRELQNTETFSYDKNQRMLTYHLVKNNHHFIDMKFSDGFTEGPYSQDFNGINGIVHRYHFQFDEQNRLSTIFRKDKSLLYKFHYREESKLIDYYELYNLFNELERSVNLNYKFY